MANFTAEYNKARLADPTLTLDAFRKSRGDTAQISSPITPIVSGNLTPQDVSGRDYEREKLALERAGISGARAIGLSENPILKRKMFEMAYSPSELSSIKDYQDLAAKDTEREGLGKQVSQLRTNAPNAMLALEDALRTKNDIGQQPIGESEMFKKAGLTGIVNLQQSLGQNLSDMSQRYGSFVNALSRVSSAMANEYSGLSSNYKGLMDEYRDQYNSLNATLEKIAQHDEAMALAEKDAQLQKDIAEFKSNLEKQSNRFQPVQDLIVPGQMWSFDKATGKYTLAKVDESGNVVQGAAPTGTAQPGSAGGSASGSGPLSFNAGAGNMRTDRNNNPIASSLSLLPDGKINMEDPYNIEWTKALADAGVAYSVEQGANFGNRATIRFETPQDGIAGAKALLGTSAFSWYKNHTGKGELANIATPADFMALPENEKDALVARIYSNEGGNGSLVSGTSSTSPLAQGPSILGQANVVASTGGEGVQEHEIPKLTAADVSKLAVKAGYDAKQEAIAVSQFKRTGEISDELSQVRRYGKVLDAREKTAADAVSTIGGKFDTLKTNLDNIETFDANTLQDAIVGTTKMKFVEGQARLFGFPTEAANYLSTRDGMSAAFARAGGEKGVLSDKDIERAIALLPKLTDSKQLRKRKLETLKKVMGLNSKDYAKSESDIVSDLQSILSEPIEDGGIKYNGGGRPEAISILNSNGWPVTEENIKAIIESE